MKNLKLISQFACFLLIMFFLSGWASAGEQAPGPQPVVSKPKQPQGYDLPREEVLSWRALEAEKRAIQAEATLAVQERQGQQKELLHTWAKRHGLPEDLAGFHIDLEAGRLLRDKEKK